MHLQVMIPLGGVCMLSKGLRIGLQAVMMDVSKAGYLRVGWTSVSSTSLLVYNFASLNLPEERHKMSEIVCTLDIFSIHLQQKTI